MCNASSSGEATRRATRSGDGTFSTRSSWSDLSNGDAIGDTDITLEAAPFNDAYRGTRLASGTPGVNVTGAQSALGEVGRYSLIDARDLGGRGRQTSFHQRPRYRS